MVRGWLLRHAYMQLCSSTLRMQACIHGFLTFQRFLHRKRHKAATIIQIRKEQHRCVKNSTKHFSNSIQSSSLNHVLDDLGTYYVQPYRMFEEEERHKLYVHPGGILIWQFYSKEYR